MLLFVYGTLQRGYPENKILKNSKLKYEGFIYASLYDLGVDFPGAVADNSGSKTWGEVYEISEGLLDELDEFEGYDAEDPEESLYIRQPVEVHIKGTPSDKNWDFGKGIYGFAGNSSLNNSKIQVNRSAFNKEKMNVTAYLMTEKKLKEFFAAEIKNGRWKS